MCVYIMPREQRLQLQSRWAGSRGLFMSALSSVTVKPNASLKTRLRFPWPQRIVSLRAILLLMSLCSAELAEGCLSTPQKQKNNALFKTFKSCLFSAPSHLHFIKFPLLKK